MPLDKSLLQTSAGLFIEDGSKIEISRSGNCVVLNVFPHERKDNKWAGTCLMLDPLHAMWIGQQLDNVIQGINANPMPEEDMTPLEEEMTEPADGTKLMQGIMDEPGADGEEYENDGAELIEYKAWARTIKQLAKEMLS